MNSVPACFGKVAPSLMPDGHGRPLLPDGHGRPLLTDGHGRSIRYLRLSVTDRCNLRCQYCRNGAETFIPHASILRYEEMAALVRLGVELGVEKVRLTGGEPFARKGFMTLLEKLRLAHPALDIRLTTNATLVESYINELIDLRIDCLNVSLDTFDRKRYLRITGRDLLPKVRQTLDTLLAAGLPVKLNAVAMRGINDGELPAFIQFARENRIDVRFIEFMPMGAGTPWTPDIYWPATDILAQAKALGTLTDTACLRPVCQKSGCQEATSQADSGLAGPAQMYALQGGGRLGLITPLSNHFCARCNRLRVTSDGRLRVCLFDDSEYRLREVLRHPHLGLPAVRRILLAATLRKPLGVHFLEERCGPVAERRMTAIGG